MLFFQRLHTKTNGRKYNQNTPGFSMKKPATRAGSDGLAVAGQTLRGRLPVGAEGAAHAQRFGGDVHQFVGG